MLFTISFCQLKLTDESDSIQINDTQIWGVSFDSRQIDDLNKYLAVFKLFMQYSKKKSKIQVSAHLVHFLLCIVRQLNGTNDVEHLKDVEKDGPFESSGKLQCSQPLSRAYLNRGQTVVNSAHKALQEDDL